jgi:hypothetical protein
MLVGRQIEKAGQYSCAFLDCIKAIAAEQHSYVIPLQDRLPRIAREPNGREEHPQRPTFRARCAPVDRQVAVGEPGDVVAEVRQPPRDGDAQACRCRLVLTVELDERLLELDLRGHEPLASPPGLERKRDHLVVQRRHHHLDTVVDDYPHSFQHVLLNRQHAYRRARRHDCEPVDELVNVGSG